MEPAYTPQSLHLLRQACQELGIRLTLLSQGWIKLLEKQGKRLHISGYTWELNSATAANFCHDKFATAQLLAHHGVPHIAHHLVHHPQNAALYHTQGSFGQLLGQAQALGYPVVLKPVRSHGGHEVQLAFTPQELESGALHLFKRHDALVLSPYVPATTERRLVMMQGQPLLCYDKTKPTVVGNGADTLETLAGRQFPGAEAALNAPLVYATHHLAPADVVPTGQAIAIDFRHNLAQGGQLQEVALSALGNALPLAQQATKALGIAFCSVDLLETAQGWQVLEVNAGVMLEQFISLHPQGPQRTKAVFTAALNAAFS